MIIIITLISPIKTKFGLICAYIERIEKQIDLIDSRVSALKMSAKLNCKKILGYFSNGGKRAALASLPNEVQVNAARRQAMLDSMDGGKFEVAGFVFCVPCCFQPLVRRVKVYCFETYSSIEDETNGVLKPLKKLLRAQRLALKVGIAYLIMVTFFIFLAAVRIGDSMTIRSILITTFSSELSGIFMVQPLEVLIFAAIIPALGAYFIRIDVRSHMESEKERGGEIKELDELHQRGSKLPQGRNFERLPFEVSPPWRKIEHSEHFRAKPGTQKQALAGSLFISGGPKAWALCVRLRAHGVRTLGELESLDWICLSERCGLSPKQVFAVWEAVHPNEAPPARIEQVTAKSNWKKLKGRTGAMSALAGVAPTPGAAPSTAPSASASGGEGDSPRKFSFLKPKKKASAVMPVLTPGDEGDGPAGNGGEESPRAAMRGGGVQEAKRNDDGRARSPRAGMRGGETTAVEQKVAASAGSSGGGGGGGGGGNRSGGGSGGGGGSFIRPIDEWLDTIGVNGRKYQHIFEGQGISTEQDLTDKLVPVQARSIIMEITEPKAKRIIRRALRDLLRGSRGRGGVAGE